MGFWKSKKRRVVVIGLDGVPYSFIREMIKAGEFPNFKVLLPEGSLTRMGSTIPCVSSVAWSSYMTGRNPGKHNIYGFVDRDPKSLDIYIPTSKNMGCQTLWEALGQQGKRVLVINVPLTYPPRPVNGILIGCFLCINIDKVAYPKEMSQTLKTMGYRIDADARQARTNEASFLEDLHETLRKRVEIGLHFYEKEAWDFFQLHIMETDRMNHFFWDGWVDETSSHREAFFKFYREIDHTLGNIVRKIDPDSELIVLSDHGFCSTWKEINLNSWLKEEGWLRLQGEASQDLKAIHPASKAYSLLPGRVYLLGENELDQKHFEKELVSSLLQLLDPSNGVAVIQKVCRREEIYQGPYQMNGPDLVAIPSPGYDLKGNFTASQWAVESEMKGMHTDDDAFLYIRNHPLRREKAEIIDLYPTILSMMKISPEKDVDGVSLIS
jgi:predicted AlkP superfamily phosphohydrolase/phosphomutase